MGLARIASGALLVALLLAGAHAQGRELQQSCDTTTYGPLKPVSRMARSRHHGACFSPSLSSSLCIRSPATLRSEGTLTVSTYPTSPTRTRRASLSRKSPASSGSAPTTWCVSQRGACGAARRVALCCLGERRTVSPHRIAATCISTEPSLCRARPAP